MAWHNMRCFAGGALAFLALAWAPPLAAQIFFQQRDGAPARPMTPAELSLLGDPFFELVLAESNPPTTLRAIEERIHPDPARRRTFVVDELIRNSRVGQVRRGVIDFTGANGTVQLGGNVMLSVFFERDGFPSTALPDIEVWGWDERAGEYNYYRLDRTGGLNGLTWKFRGSSREADEFTVEERRGTCLRCHVRGAPVMKELLLPWNNWHSVAGARQAEYLKSPSLLPDPWSVASGPHLRGRLTGAEVLEAAIIGSLGRFTNRRIDLLVTRDDAGGTLVPDARRLLQPIFVTNEVNFISDRNGSQLHPLSEPALPGPSPATRIAIPNTFFLNAEVLGGGIQIAGLGVDDALKFSVAATLSGPEYKRLVLDRGLQLRIPGPGATPGDADFAWFTPEPAYIDAKWVDELVRRQLVTPEFVAAVMAVDLETPIFSEPRAALLRFVPESYRPGGGHPDALTEAVIAAIDAEDPPTGSAAEEFRTLLQLDDAVAELETRITAYSDRTAARLADPATRDSELERLFDLLIERRAQVENHPVIGNIVESGAFLPVP
jgi:hypothetical protein